MRKSNLTYNELIELAPKDRPFQVEVEIEIILVVSPQKIKDEYWAMIDTKKLRTFLFNNYNWETDYKGTFTLIDEYRNMYEKPEVLKVGTEVEILESARDCGDYDEWHREHKDLVGRSFKVKNIIDNDSGILYGNGDGFWFPHYCVRPVEKVEEKEEVKKIPEFDGMIEEFEGLCIKAQDIISKYKK